MKEALLYRLSNWLWTAIVLTIVALALYVSMGRFLMGNVAQFQDDILREVNARLNFVIEADNLRGRWESLTPYLELSGARVLGNDHAEAGIEIEHLNLGFDLFSSLRTGGLQLYALKVDSLSVHVDIDAEGQMEIPGIPPGGGVLAEQVLRFVLNTEWLQIEDFELSFHQGERLRTVYSSVRLLRDSNFRRLNASVFNPGEKSWVRVVGEAEGDPMDLDALDADLHMQLQVSDAESYDDLARLGNFSIGRGQLSSEVWVSVRRGDLRTAADFLVDDVAVKQLGENQSEMVFDNLSATFRADRGDEGWSFGASDIKATGNTQEFNLEAISGTLRDSILQFQFANIDVASLVDYALSEELLPAASKDLFASLSPGGHFTRLQATIDDLDNVTTSWRLQANFKDLSVNSWKGAPSISNGSGYLSLSREEGRLQISSNDFSMGFPNLYRHTLDYESFATELAFSVDDDGFELWSGPFSGTAEEGRVHGLFALSVPFGESITGLEMDLLVGIEDAHPRYRAKYLPYTLPSGLLNWLENSIGDGSLNDAGFIFRGSLRPGNIPHRSVQLFSNVERAELNYHPDWPPLADVKASLYVDNTNVDAYAERATIYGSEAHSVEVHLRSNSAQHLMLDLEGLLEGSAQDGLDVVNQSPLRKLVGDSFLDWQLNGEMDAEIGLLLNLTNLQQPPEVRLDARLKQVNLDTGSLGIVVEDIDGSFSYRTQTGFSADNISGRLWDQPLLAKISQGRSKQGLNDLDIQVNGLIESDAVRNWLQLDMLRLAEGRTEAEMHIILPPAGGPRLEITSRLEGVALDLPQQYAKPADSAALLNLEMALGPTPRRLSMSLGEQTWLDLELGEAGLQAAGLGFGTRVEPEIPQVLLVGGQVASMAWDPWMKFVDDYVVGGEAWGGESVDGSASVLVHARDLQIGELNALGQTAYEVTLSAQQLPASWQLQFSADWLRGSAHFPATVERVNLDLDYLNLDSLPQSIVDSLEGEGGAALDMPVLQVTVKELISDDKALGDLSFKAVQDAGNYHFSGIKGNLRGLILGEDEELTLDWLGQGDQVTTQVKGPVKFLNFGAVLVDYGYDEIVETNSGNFDLDIEWEGSPTNFSLANTTGHMGIAVDQGSFLKTSAAAEGTLRVMGILNLAEFVRRLSFDMNYLFKSGIPFDSINGELLLHDGIVEVPQMDVLGASSRFQFVGLVDANKATIGGEMVATLPVASNLPWIVALIGGLPAAAGVFVVSKVFTKQVDRFSSGIYSINGPWEDPEVKFERIFDNTASHQKVVAEQLVDAKAEGNTKDVEDVLEDSASVESQSDSDSDSESASSRK